MGEKCTCPRCTGVPDDVPTEDPVLLLEEKPKRVMMPEDVLDYWDNSWIDL